MKAAVFRGKEQIEIQEIPNPEPAESEVLLKVLGCGVCGTDAHIYTGHVQNAKPPVVLGHEILGKIEKIGRGVIGFRVGDWVVVDPFIYCGYCDFCRNGEYRFCLNETFIGYHRTGGFAQYTTAPFTNLYHVPKGIGLKNGIIAETLSTVIAGLNRLGAEPGRSFLVLGAGTVGLLWNQVLRKTLAVTLIQTELIQERRAKAKYLGADRVLSPDKEDLEQTVFEMCPHGVDYIIDATGSTEAIEEALPLIKRGGTFLSFGICPEEERLSLSLNWFYKKQVQFVTSRRPPREMERAVFLLEKGLIDADVLVTGQYPLEQIEQTFQRFFEAKDQEIKMAIDPWL